MEGHIIAGPPSELFEFLSDGDAPPSPSRVTVPPPIKIGALADISNTPLCGEDEEGCCSLTGDDAIAAVVVVVVVV